MIGLGPVLLAAALASAEQSLGHVGNRWAWSPTDEVFVPQLVMYATPAHFYQNPGKVDRDIDTYIHDYGFSGFHVFVSCRWFDIETPECTDAPPRDPPLDPRTFEALEMLIRKTAAAGGMVHLWMWGDEERGQTPSAVPGWGGLDGSVARKVESEIARRLGPIPGWSLGYGFDLDEWVRVPEIHAWRDRLQAALPRFHFLGGRPQGPNDGRHHERYERWNRELDYTSFEHHKPTYEVYVAALSASPDKPVMSEDRFRVLHSDDRKHYSPEEIRRGLWHSTLAGGVANIWGYLKDGGSHELGSAPFPNRGQIRTHFEFIRDRFLTDMTRCSAANTSPRKRPLCLGSTSAGRVLLYKEESDRVALDLSKLSSHQPAVAVDTLRPYEEIALGRYAPGKHVWTAPYRSDWAIAVGDFDRGAERITTTVERRPELTARASRNGGVELSWTEPGERDSVLSIERAASAGSVPGAFSEIGRVSAGTERFHDLMAEQEVTYWYRLRDADGFTETVRVHASARESVVRELSPTSYRIARAQSGSRHYVDRDYTLSSVPPFLSDALLISTANDDKLATGERFLTFTLLRPATVYVAFDRRATRVPYWLDEWEIVRSRLTVEGDGMRYFTLRKRAFEAGPVVLGANAAAGSEWGDDGRSQFVVLIDPK